MKTHNAEVEDILINKLRLHDVPGFYRGVTVQEAGTGVFAVTVTISAMFPVDIAAVHVDILRYLTQQRAETGFEYHLVIR